MSSPAWRNCWFSFILAYSRISHEYSSFFIIVINLIFMFSLWCIDWVGSLYGNRILCISVLRVALGPRVKLAGCKSALNSPVVYSTGRSKAVVPVLLFVALWFIPRSDLFYVLPCVILFLWFSVLLALRLPRLGKGELILVLFVRLFDLCLFGFVGVLFLFVSGKGCGLWLWHSLDFSLAFFVFLISVSSFLDLGVSLKFQILHSNRYLMKKTTTKNKKTKKQQKHTKNKQTKTASQLTNYTH